MSFAILPGACLSRADSFFPALPVFLGVGSPSCVDGAHLSFFEKGCVGGMLFKVLRIRKMSFFFITPSLKFCQKWFFLQIFECIIPLCSIFSGCCWDFWRHLDFWSFILDFVFPRKLVEFSFCLQYSEISLRCALARVCFYSGWAVDESFSGSSVLQFWGFLSCVSWLILSLFFLFGYSYSWIGLFSYLCSLQERYSQHSLPVFYSVLYLCYHGFNFQEHLFFLVFYFPFKISILFSL